jgi:hypothetical protein
VILALALVFVGYQWNQAATRAEALGAQVSGLRTEAETQRLRAEDAQRQVDLIQKRLAQVAAEKESLADRVVALEKASSARAAGAEKAKRKGTATAAAEKPKSTKSTAAGPARPRATPVATTKRAP